MAKRSKEEIIKAVTDLIGDRTDDLVIALLEDIADSYPDESVDWQKKLDDLDKEWRGRYMERFNAPINTDKKEPDGEDTKVIEDGANDKATDDLIDDLFELNDKED